MKLTASLLIVFFMLCLSVQALAKNRFGEQLCRQTDYFCIKVRSGESWANLFPNPESRDIARRINRMNVRLKPGMIIAIPKYLERVSIYDVAPFPRYIESNGERSIYVSQKDLAWAAYDQDGELLWWGPISPGKGNCQSRDRCKTPPGSYRIIRKQDIDCVSTAFPRRANGDHGGAPMPYCMHFFRGYALHGSSIVPGYADSHGCVRMFIEDARWLNEEFITVPGSGNRGTRVIIGSPTRVRS